jgi:parallel beta-helix repeat protein
MKTKAIFGIILIATLIWIGCATEEDSVTGEPGKSGTQISGDLTGTLSASSSPYWVTGDLRVPAGENLTIDPGVELRFDGLYKFVVQGENLTIDPGVELRFDGLYKFVVQGHLEAVGTAEENIVFTSMDGALGSGDFGQWRALVFDTGSDVSKLAFCRIQYAAVWDSSARYPEYADTTQTGWWLNGAIFVWNCSPFIGNCTVLKNGYHGIYCIGSETNPYILKNNIFENVVAKRALRLRSGTTTAGRIMPGSLRIARMELVISPS